MVVRLSNLEADVKEDLPNSRKILLDFKEEHKQRVTGIQQVKTYVFVWWIKNFLIVEYLRRRLLSGKRGLMQSN